MFDGDSDRLVLEEDMLVGGDAANGFIGDVNIGLPTQPPISTEFETIGDEQSRDESQGLNAGPSEMHSDLSDIPFDDLLDDFSEDEDDELILLEAGSVGDDGSFNGSAEGIGIGIGDATSEPPVRKPASTFERDDDLEWLAGSQPIRDEAPEQPASASAEAQMGSSEHQRPRPEHTTVVSLSELEDELASLEDELAGLGLDEPFLSEGRRAKRPFTVKWQPTLGTIAKSDMLSSGDKGATRKTQSSGELSPVLSAALDGVKREESTPQPKLPPPLPPHKQMLDRETASPAIAVPETPSVPFERRRVCIHRWYVEWLRSLIR